MIRKTITAAALVAGALAVASSALANTNLYEQDFDGTTGDWAEFDATVTNGGGDVLQISGTGPEYGAYSYYGGIASDAAFRMTPMGDGYISELDVYLDPSAPVGNGFDLSVASSRVTDGSHQQDHIFHVENKADGLFVDASHNSAWQSGQLTGADAAEVIDAGWYTLQHVFGDDGNGYGEVTFNVLDSDGDPVWSAILPISDGGAAVPVAEVGSPRYQWATIVIGTFDFDNQSLERVVAAPGDKDDCKQGGFEAFGFANQGQCVASIEANENANR